MYGRTAASGSGDRAASFSDAVEPAAALGDLFRDRPLETLAPGRALFWEGDEAAHVFEVAEGALRMCRLLPDDRRAIIGFAQAGDLLGVCVESRYLFTAEAVTRVRTRRIARSRFFTTIDATPALRRRLLAILCGETSTARDQVVLLGRRTAEERVAGFLLAVHRKSPAGARIDLPMSRRDIADYLGLTVETVSRMMTSLSRRGLIAVGTGRSISLREAAALKRLAGQDDDETAKGSPPRRAVWPN